jgi:hypothetical protein
MTVHRTAGLIWRGFGAPAKKFAQLSQILPHLLILNHTNFVARASHHRFSSNKIYILLKEKHEHYVPNLWAIFTEKLVEDCENCDFWYRE